MGEMGGNGGKWGEMGGNGGKWGGMGGNGGKWRALGGGMGENGGGGLGGNGGKWRAMGGNGELWDMLPMIHCGRCRKHMRNWWETGEKVENNGTIWDKSPIFPSPIFLQPHHLPLKFL